MSIPEKLAATAAAKYLAAIGPLDPALTILEKRTNMLDWSTLKERSIAGRRAIANLLAEEAHRADTIPPIWNNNLHWHAGHLVTTPHLLTYGVLGEPLPIPAEYRGWFAKGTSPREWGGAPVPSFTELQTQLIEVMGNIFDQLESRADQPFSRPYMTSLGIELRTPEEALMFSMVHDGIHIGMIQALKRGLNAMDAREVVREVRL